MTASPDAKKGLGTTAARGMFWTGGGQILRQMVQLISSVLLARLLVPDDFGMLGMALVIVGIGQIFADFGIGAAIVQSQTADRLVLSSCFWANLAVGVLLALAISLASPLIAAFYQRPTLAPLVVAASLTLVLSAAMVVPRSLLYKDMRFAELAKAQFLGSVGGAIVAVGLAWAGFGVWSLVIQPLAGTAITLAVSWGYARLLPKLEFSWSGIRGLVRFSVGVLGTDLLNYANRNTDSLLIGRTLGAGPLGFYSMSYQIMLYPLQQVSSVIVKVLFPTLSQLQNELPRFREAYLKCVGAIALITFPMMMGLFVVAEDFIRVVFGEKWLPMLDVLRILAGVGMIQSISTTVGSIYLSTGNVRRLFTVAAIGTPLLIVAIVVGLQWGIVGVALGYAGATLVVFYFNIGMAIGLVDLSLRQFHSVLWRPLSCSLVMASAVYASGIGMLQMPATLRFSAMVAVGVLTYTLACLVVNRRQIMEIVCLVSSLRGRGAVKVPK